MTFHEFLGFMYRIDLEGEVFDADPRQICGQRCRTLRRRYLLSIRGCGILLCGQDCSHTFQEVPYRWNWFVWPHSCVKITETIDAPARSQSLSQVHRCYSAVRDGIEVALRLPAWSGESISQVGQIDQSVTGEGLVEHGDALIEQHCRLSGLTQL